jgi:hypothetical protein
MREGSGQAPGAAAAGATEAGASGNGSHDAPAPPVSAPPPADRAQDVADQPAQREFHSEPREPSAAHEAAPIAHFEPTPKPDSTAAGKPYVVWSSAPPKDVGSRGSED